MFFQLIFGMHLFQILLLLFFKIVNSIAKIFFKNNSLTYGLILKRKIHGRKIVD